MMHFDIITNENNKTHKPKWVQIPDHPYKILIKICRNICFDEINTVST